MDLETYTHIVQYLFIGVALVGYYVTSVHFKWWNAYKPSPLVRHLLIAAIAIDISATIIAGIAILGLLGIAIDPAVRLSLITFALIITLGVKAYRRIDLRALDHPDEDLTQRVESQNQREDRSFGDARRKLEIDHLRKDE